MLNVVVDEAVVDAILVDVKLALVLVVLVVVLGSQLADRKELIQVFQLMVVCPALRYMFV